MKFLIVLAFTGACAVLGRMGGSGNYPRQTRVVGIPILLALQAFVLGVHSWWLVLMIPVTIGAISTYGDTIFGYDQFFFVGFILGLSSFPIAIATGHWWLFGLRVALLTALIGLWCKFVGNAVIEEGGRYALLPATLWMIC